MDHQPPPFFKRGPAPLARLFFYVTLSLVLIVIDARFHTLDLARQSLSLITDPLQRAAQMPAALLVQARAYLSSVARLQEENFRMKREQLDNAANLTRTEQLERENARLRRLLELREREHPSGVVAQILHAVRDPYTQRIVVDKGQMATVTAGQPVIDDVGVIGQVTRVFPFAAEITLLTDKDQSIPVQVVRNGLRSIAFGLGDGQLELRFMPANADINNGDLIVTSGLDGVFPRGLPVARVTHIERNASYAFPRIFCKPLAGVENYNEVMVLAVREPVAIPEELRTPRPSAGGKSGKKKRPKRG
ncbi:rod shape-determining protein MreC [Dentiradicibacter hellwigii]|uniref:Cell shape-determining protein MreC n=1 Tax=Dentiradicibacter hellwigii TaxID=3149053 RepID=A0ABV4UI05_9RHOO